MADILFKIRNGEDFDKIQAAYSQDYYPDMKNHPGGFVVEQGYPAIAKTLEDTVFALTRGT